MKPGFIAYIYQTKHIEEELWPACVKSMGDDKGNNYVFVTSDDEMNGLYMWKKSNIKEKHYKTVMNYGCVCWRVPLEDAVKIKNLEDITDEYVRNKIIKMQEDWFTGKVKGQAPKKRKSKYYLKK